jgi:cytochrome P450
MKDAMAAEVAPAIDLPLPPEPGILETFRRGRLMRSDPLACTMRMYESEGPVVGQRMGLFRSVNLFGPDAVKQVLLNREGIFSNKQAWDLIIGKIFTNGLMLRDGEDHRNQRSIMQGAFKRPALEEYLGHMNPQIAAHLSHWRAADPFLVYPAFKRLTLDLACSVFLGIELGPEAERVNRAFEDTVAASMAVMRLRLPGLAWTRGLEGREYMVDFLRRLIPAKRKGAGSDMFSQLCRVESEEGRTFSDQEIIDHMIFLMMAAHDTTTSTLTSMMYELALHPEWQGVIREESRSLGKAEIDVKGLESPGAIQRVMNETLRRYPPLSTMPRMATREFQYGGYRVPAGTMVIVFPIHTHHMSEWWTNPFSFDPERFSDARAEHRRHSHSFVPFGGGAHMCIGFRFAEIQIRAILHQIVQRFRWSVRKGYTMPVQQSPISKPKDGLPVRLEALA